MVRSNPYEEKSAYSCVVMIVIEIKTWPCLLTIIYRVAIMAAGCVGES